MTASTLESLRERRDSTKTTEQPNIRLDMFSSQGFALAQRVAHAYASSDAVPAQFRSHNLKKAGGTEQWVENPSAIGNCLVAIEVAQSIGMSVAMVMQNADMIEGKLRWSSKFQIAAINASRRFSPLRFDFRNHGRIKAAYKEKTGWDKEARKPIYAEREVEIENIECIAWAVPSGTPIPPGIGTLHQARDAGLPVVEGAPSSMKMAVEEGWYGKAGSKWQGEMKTLMLQYRAGSFFGGIHAPDIVMGMGHSAEEERDIIDAERQPDGGYAVNVADLKTENAPKAGVAASQSTAGPAEAPQETQEPTGAGNTRSGAATDAEGTASTDATAQPVQQEGPTLDDAMNAVLRGDLDTAADMSRGLSAKDRKLVEKAIANKMQEHAPAQSGLSME